MTLPDPPIPPPTWVAEWTNYQTTGAVEMARELQLLVSVVMGRAHLYDPRPGEPLPLTVLVNDVERIAHKYRDFANRLLPAD